MSKTNVPQWDTTAANNTDLASITSAENAMYPGNVNNYLREMVSQVAKLYDDLGGVNTVGGTGDVITVTTSSVFTALATGLILAFKAGATNTTNVTINVDGLGAKAVRKFTTADVALAAGDLVSGGKYLLVYDAAANSAAGAWILINPSAASASSSFADNVFFVTDDGDATKKIAFQASGITTGTTRTLTAQDLSGLNALEANVSLAASVGSSALTVSLKGLNGSDPSATNPVNIQFRSATAATGSITTRTVTAATSIVVASTKTMGTSNGVAFRLWVVAVDTGSGIELGLVNALSGTSIMTLRDDQLVSPTATPANSAQVIYTTSGQTTKPMRILGYLDFSSGEATAGTWATAPDKIQLFGPGIAKPGDVIQVQRNDTGASATGTTVLPSDDTIPQNTEGDQFMSQAITPVAAPNLLRVTVSAALSASANSLTMALFQDTTANALKAIRSGVASTAQFPIVALLLAGSTAATTFKMRAGPSGAATTTFNGTGGARQYGGVYNSFMEVSEIMA